MNGSNNDLNHELSSPLIKKVQSLEKQDLQSTVEAKVEKVKVTKDNIKLQAGNSDEAQSGDESVFEAKFA